MKNETIEDLVYILKKAKNDNQPRPIFFLGAGASKSGNIPLANDIVKHILEKYSDAPKIKNLKTEDQTYPKLMECLLPYERDELLKEYIDKAKINVTHIYLAQLMSKGYIDYVLTVNFDNLMLRALSLFNEFPPTYDMAILNDLTTSKFKEKSVIYLHGQHHGLWLLNTEEEMSKVNKTVPRVFDSIKNRRTWVFIGYSGNDPIFKHIKKLGRFDNGLYWIAYKDYEPNKKVKDFLRTPNNNTSIIKGYDSDSFMLSLNAKLNLGQPEIINTPFSAVKKILNSIVDIDDDKHFHGIKERLKISKEQVNDAIQQFENGKTVSNTKSKDNYRINLLKREIIEFIINEKYDRPRISELYRIIQNKNNKELNNLLANLYFNWGTSLGNLAKTKENYEVEKFYTNAFEKFKKAVNLKSDIPEIFNNWGCLLGDLAQTKNNKNAEILYNKALDKFQSAINIKPNSHRTLYNWGNNLGNLASIKEGVEADKLYNQAFEKFQKAINTKIINVEPNDYEIFNLWGFNLGNLAKIKNKDDADILYNKAFEKYREAANINPIYYKTFENWGNNLGFLAKTKKGENADELYNQAFEKFKIAIDLKPDSFIALNNWGFFLTVQAKTKEQQEADELYNKALEKYKEAAKINPKSYNLACIYALKREREKAFKYLRDSLKDKEQEASSIRKDEDWEGYLNDKEFIALLKTEENK